MTRTKIFGATIALVFAVSMIGTAFAASNFLTVVSATTGEDSTLTTKSPIPTNGNKGAFGYGVIGATGVLVATTHGGVGPDTEAQEDQSDPVMHIHTVTLGPNAGCPDGTAVTSITDESDDMQAIVDGKTLVMKGYTGQVGALTSIVASFTLSVIGNPANPTAVCVNDLQVFDFS